MKIDTNKPASPAHSPVSGGPLRAPEAAAAAGDGVSDTVRLSSRPSDGGMPWDGDRIATLREAVREGRYQPDAERIADAVLAFDRALDQG